ncbi:hypothetical protein QTP70_002920 [Hemibagrus guttatus]|uniref:Ig-like domain-containing protein n=1 Tax=Hemibagrus guttatus TaxID=175788 RepID=A0AAE0QI62_9TELE|nr:hypothetical protein QTP70_002920 [Hemibagrus guttatus]KAK3549550.1 hypothetical protein QTP86_003958 [Hemibagrus guttatus]
MHRGRVYLGCLDVGIAPPQFHSLMSPPLQQMEYLVWMVENGCRAYPIVSMSCVKRPDKAPTILCAAEGFYPADLEQVWLRDGEYINYLKTSLECPYEENLNTSDINCNYRNNTDGSYSLTSYLSSQTPQKFPTERFKIAYMIALLTGKALAWATAIWQHRLSDHPTVDTFITALRSTFDHSSKERGLTSSLLRMHQGIHSVAAYTIDFRTVAATSGWNEQALQAAYVQGLSEELKDELAARDPPDNLEALYELMIRMDNRLQETQHRHAYRRGHLELPSGALELPEPPLKPMQLPIHQFIWPGGVCLPKAILTQGSGQRQAGHPLKLVKKQGPTQVEGFGLALNAVPHSSGLFLSATLHWGKGRQAAAGPNLPLSVLSSSSWALLTSSAAL